MGLGLYYERRVLDAAGRPPKPADAEPIATARYVRSIDEDRAELPLLVEGIHCGACVWLIESVLARLPGVIEARVNMTTKRLRLRFQPSLADPDALIESVERLGYRLAPFDPVRATSLDARHNATLLKALAVAGFAAGNLMLLSIGIWVGFDQGMGEATRSLLHWASAAIALPAVAYAGRPFFDSALTAIRHGRTNMDVPISLGVLLVTGMSLAETIHGGPSTYFDSAAMLLFFLLIGRVLDQRARGRAREAAQMLLGLRIVDVAVRRPDGTIERVPQDRVERGQCVAVGMGERVGVDGIIERGSSSLDTSLVTGESLPVAVEPGTQVFAGSINLGGPLEIRVAATGEATLLAECVRLIEAAEHGRGRFVLLADRVAQYYAPIVHLAAATTFLVWWQIFGIAWMTALLDATSVLIITCPCALALAVPAVQVIATGGLFRAGILLKSPSALERLAAVDMVVFDKTGTLTLPQLTLTRDDSWTDADLTLAAGLASRSNHPLARALVEGAPPTAELGPVSEIAGSGLICASAEGEIRLGSRRFCGVVVGPVATGPELWLQRPGQPAIRFSFAETVRNDAATTITRLHKDGIGTQLLSGDRFEPVEAVGCAIGISPRFANQTPVDKVAALETLKREGWRVLMVGDGLNDGPALAAASVSMSPATAADISQTIADVVFQGQNLAPVATVLATARKARHLIRQNIALSVLYNLVMVPLAMAGYVTPWLAAAAMSGSSLMVILNSVRLGRGQSS